MTSPAQMLCPACGERLAVQTKKNAAGDSVARRACTVTGDYAEPWQHVPVAAARAAVQFSDGARMPTAAGSARQAPLPVSAPIPKVR